MKKYTLIIIGFLLFIIVLISGCNGSSPDVGGVIGKGIDLLTCLTNPNYKYIGGECCSDLNQNKVCESDEPRLVICKSECEFSDNQCHEGNVHSCQDLNGDGCKEFKLEKTCADDESCKRGTCILDIKCGDSVCDEEIETCDTCPKDCSKVNELCCDGKSIGGECCTVAQCGENQQCENNKCIDIKFCGDNICNQDIENCETCHSDCKTNEGGICCGGTLLQGTCCSNENCSMNEECISYVCTPLNETASNET